MANIKANVSEDTLNKMKEMINRSKGSLVGAEMTISSITRYALEKFIKEQDQTEEIKTIPINTKNLSKGQLEDLSKSLTLLRSIYCNDESEKSKEYKDIKDLDIAVKYMLFALQ